MIARSDCRRAPLTSAADGRAISAPHPTHAPDVEIERNHNEQNASKPPYRAASARLEGFCTRLQPLSIGVLEFPVIKEKNREFPLAHRRHSDAQATTPIALDRGAGVGGADVGYWTRVQGHGPNRDLRSTQPIPLGGPSIIEKLYPCVHLIGAVGGKGQELLDVVVGPVGALGKIDATRPNSLEMRGQTLPFGTRVGCTRDDCQPAEGRRLVDQRRTIAGVLNKRDVWEVLTAEAHER